jgi:hypothetical protein
MVDQSVVVASARGGIVEIRHDTILAWTEAGLPRWSVLKDAVMPLWSILASRLVYLGIPGGVPIVFHKLKEKWQSRVARLFICSRGEVSLRIGVLMRRGLDVKHPVTNARIVARPKAIYDLKIFPDACDKSMIR